MVISILCYSKNACLQSDLNTFSLKTRDGFLSIRSFRSLRMAFTHLSRTQFAFRKCPALTRRWWHLAQVRHSKHIPSKDFNSFIFIFFANFFHIELNSIYSKIFEILIFSINFFFLLSDVIESGIRFYEKLLNKNIAIRELSGKDLYSVKGNEYPGLLRYNIFPLTTRKLFLENALQEAKKKEEEEANKSSEAKTDTESTNDTSSK